jgi:hypothetical protein
MTGSLSVLNVGAGDIEVRFNPHQPEEIARAIKMLRDMQQRGYAILVKQDDGSYARAVEIDEQHACYVISGEPQAPAQPSAETPPATKTKNGRRGRRRQPIASSHAVGVARSAGG